MDKIQRHQAGAVADSVWESHEAAATLQIQRRQAGAVANSVWERHEAEATVQIQRLQAGTVADSVWERHEAAATPQTQSLQAGAIADPGWYFDETGQCQPPIQAGKPVNLFRWDRVFELLPDTVAAGYPTIRAVLNLEPGGHQL
jgi:hypothetical protein